MNYDIPLTRVKIPLKYLTRDEQNEELILGYWYAVSLIPGRTIGCHVTLVDGSNWSRLPLHFLLSEKCKDTLDFETGQAIQVYDCLSYHGSVNEFKWLKGQPVTILDAKLNGKYLFTVDYDSPDSQSPFAEDVEQHKQHHIFECADGTIRARPNNFLRWEDRALYKPFIETPPYKRLTEKFSAEDLF